MGLATELQPATDMFSGGFARLASYAWVLIPVVILFAIGIGAFIFHKVKQKNTQWTHILRVRRVLPDGRLTNPITHRMRRFPLVKKAEVFELEKPLLGGYLIPELEEYSGHNEFSIILDRNNRIYTNKGEFFKPETSSVFVSAKHAEIDVQRQNLKANFQNVNKVNKRIEWTTIAKYAMWSVAIIAITIVGIVGIQNWGEAQQFEAQQAQANAMAMEELNKALDSVESNTNGMILLTEKLKELYGTNNIQGVIESVRSG